MPESQSELHGIVQLSRQLLLTVQAHNVKHKDVKIEYWFIFLTESIFVVKQF